VNLLGVLCLFGILKETNSFIFIFILCLLRILLGGLASINGFSVDKLAPRTVFSFEPTVSLGKASYHRDKHVKLIINSIFLSNVSRVLSTNKYNVDLSSCKFY
jgi:hypothetical protein